VRKHIVVSVTWVNSLNAVAVVWTSVQAVKSTAKCARTNYAHPVVIQPWPLTVRKVESISATVVIKILCEMTLN
jgi:hypothetical protein